MGFGNRRADRIPERETAGQVREVLRAADGTEIVTIEFPAGGGPQDGASGAPVVDGAGRVVGIAVWEAARAVSPDAVDVSGVAAASLGCVTRLPSNPAPASPMPAPLRPL